jgi:hypothetical protein
MRPIRFFKRIAMFIAFFVLMAAEIGLAQDAKKYNSELIVEFKNFTEEKVLPSLNQSFNEKKGAKVVGYCPYQDLVIFQYNTSVYPTAEDLLVSFEKMGYTVYIKFDMNRDIMIKECKSEFKKL